MKRLYIFKTLGAAVIAGAPFVCSTVAQAQGGYGMGAGMMGGNGGAWMGGGGGYGGIWLLVLLVAVVAGLVGWLIAKKRK